MDTSALSLPYALNLNSGTPPSDPYASLVSARFLAMLIDEGCTHTRGLGWATETGEPEALGEVVHDARYHYNDSHELVVRHAHGMSHVILYRGQLVARTAARSAADLDAIERHLRAQIPETTQGAQVDKAIISFWRESRPPLPVKVDVCAWADIAGNYPAQTAAALGRMMSSFEPGRGGRLLLWTGAPGTGKTHALRALAWEWRKWCSLHYVIDPERLLGADADYLVNIAMNNPGSRWRVIVLEDTGELLSADAKSRTGPGLGRFLNLSDGLIGQQFPTLVLVTTNEPMRSLHPAVARPGRCAAHIEFATLSQPEAHAWLDRAGAEAPDGSLPSTLAGLYALADRRDPLEASARDFGFAGTAPGPHR